MTPSEVTTILRQFNEWRRGDEDIPQLDPREIGEAIDAAIAMIDRLEAAESDALEQARLNGMGASREATLMAKLEAAEKERDALRLAVRHEADCVDAAKAEIEALRARIEAMEQQEPVAWLHESRRDSDVVTSAVKHVWGKVAVGSLAAYSIPLYLAPGAQPAPSLASNDVSLISEGKTQPAQSVKDVIIDDLQSQFDTEGITEHDSGDALIRLSDAIAAVEDNFAQPYKTTARTT